MNNRLFFKPTVKVASILLLLLLIIVSCSDNAVGPNDIGGDVVLELTEPGNNFPISLRVGDSYDPRFDSFKDSTFVLSRDNGIVTFRGRYTFDSAFVRALDTILGLHTIPDPIKRVAIDTYLSRYGAILDTTDKNNIKLTVDFKAKITSDGIAEFFSSKGDVNRPRTLFKYAWNIGDSYSFKDDYGIEKTRKVIAKSTIDDFPLAFWNIKVIQVEETVVDDPLISSIKFIGNHKFGLVGLNVVSKNSKTMKLTVFPPTLK